MTIDKCFALNIGDKVVRVRGYFKNYDHQQAKEVEATKSSKGIK